MIEGRRGGGEEHRPFWSTTDSLTTHFPLPGRCMARRRAPAASDAASKISQPAPLKMWRNKGAGAIPGAGAGVEVGDEDEEDGGAGVGAADGAATWEAAAAGRYWALV